MPSQRSSQRSGNQRGLIHERIVRSLGARIVGGGIAPGQTVGSEAELSVEFQASRTAVREAIKVLAAKGMVESRPRAGTSVRPMREWALLDPQVLDWGLHLPSLSNRLIRDLHEMRRSFEPEAAALAAVRRTDEQVRALRRQLRGMSLYVDLDDRIEQDLSFHQTILEATGNGLFLACPATARRSPPRGACGCTGTWPRRSRTH